MCNCLRMLRSKFRLIDGRNSRWDWSSESFPTEENVKIMRRVSNRTPCWASTYQLALFYGSGYRGRLWIKRTMMEVGFSSLGISVSVNYFISNPEWVLRFAFRSIFELGRKELLEEPRIPPLRYLSKATGLQAPTPDLVIGISKAEKWRSRSPNVPCSIFANSVLIIKW